MNVALLVHSLRKGGAERLVLEIANGLTKIGHTVNIITWIDEDSFKSEYPSINRNYLLKKENYNGFKSIPKSILPLRKILKRIKPDIIHVHSPNIATLLSFSFLGIPSVHIIHGYGKIGNDVKKIKDKLFNLLDITTSLFLNKNFVLVSFSMLEFAKKYFYFNYFKFTVIKNGIDIKKFSYKVNPLSKNIINIIMIGTICENKGQEHALKILEILDLHNLRFKLTFVGDGPDLKKLKQIIFKSKLENIIDFIPVADNITELLHQTHIFWILSKSEALPMVVLESMASGVVVVGYNVRGVKDAVINNETGLLSEYNNYNKIAESTLYLINNDCVRINFTKNARMRIESEFSLNTMILEYEKLSNKILYG